MFHVTRVAAGFFILSLAADVAVTLANHQQQGNAAVTDPTPSSVSAPQTQQQDQRLQSTVTSYKSVVIHHHNHAPLSRQATTNSSTSPANHQDADKQVDQKKESSRSEMYFTMHNSHAKPRQPEDHTQRPSKPTVETAKVQRSPSDQIKITRFEGDFRPMMTLPPQNHQRRPQRLTSQPNYSSAESDESYSSDEQPTNYRGPANSEEDYTPKYEKLRTEKPKYDHPTPEVTYRNDEPKRVYSSGKSFRGSQSFTRGPPIKAYKAKSPPPGMTEELMDTLLQQEPQTFDPEKYKRTEQKKKFKSSESPTTFNVGYSIGFGQPQSDDIIMGRPKDVKLHVNGQSSVWKQLNENIEMSQDLGRNKESFTFRVPDSTPRTVSHKVNVINNNGQSVLYLNKDGPTIDSVPTAGRTSFDHNRALTRSNLFDISNAVASPPIALPLTSNYVPEHHHEQQVSRPAQPKARELDIMNLYQSMGYSSPVPVLLPGSKGEAQMVHAIVIPIHSMPQLDFNWATHFPAMYSHHAPTVIAAPTFVPAFTTTTTTNNDAAAYANVITQSTRPPFLPTPTTTHHYHNHNHHPHHSVRSPKSSRKPKDTNKYSATFSSPIVVAPTGPSRQDLKKEQATLNAILAQELSRKNRHMPLGLRPSS